MALSTIHAARQNLDKKVRARVIERFTEEFVFESVIPRAVSVGVKRLRVAGYRRSRADQSRDICVLQTYDGDQGVARR
jgi:hypothetical protein